MNISATRFTAPLVLAVQQKFTIPLLVLTVILAGCTLISPSVVDNSGVPIRSCPYGHATLRKIPIEYGMLMPGKKLDKAIENYKFIPGGCVMRLDSPKNALLCTTCKFVFHPPRGSGGKGYWSRRSEDMASFKEGFPSLLLSVPFSDKGDLIGKSVYSQLVSDGQVIRSSLQYVSREPMATLKSNLVHFLESNPHCGQYAEQLNSTNEWIYSNPYYDIMIRRETNNTSSIVISVSPAQE